MNIKSQKVFVTGGAGFIGSHIVESLLKQGASIAVYDNLSFGKMNNLTPFAKDLRFIQGDILDYDCLKSSIKGHDIVSHHAAQLEIFLGVEAPIRDLEINTIGTLNILRAAHENNVVKVINASSACVYGQTINKTNEEHLPFPNWEYGVSKLAAERYGKIYNDYHNLPVTSLRYGIVYGEKEWFRRVLTILIKRAIRNEPLVVFGKGDQVRDFVYVKDAVRLHNACIENDESNGQIYNVGTGIPTSIVTLANTVASVAQKMFNREVPIIHEETLPGERSKLVEGKKRNVAELQMMLLDPTKAYRDLQWKPDIDLPKGIEYEMSWATQNLDQWHSIHYSSMNE